MSSLAFGLIYLLLAVVSLRRFRADGQRLSLGFLLLSIGFISLAVPLALSPQWTSVAWMIEGLAILWFACLQNSGLSAGVPRAGAARVCISALQHGLYLLVRTKHLDVYLPVGRIAGCGALHHHFRLMNRSKLISGLLIIPP